VENKINLNSIYKPSEDVVAREVQGEFIIIPITSGVGDLEEEIFSLNETGKMIWDKLDGKRTLKDVVKDLSLEFESPQEEIEKDILGFMEELLKRRIVIETK
jgi:coenzyme PQQ biosynthesis protein PqqD